MVTQEQLYKLINQKLLIFLTDRHRHLVCLPYNIHNLHLMAQELGIKRCWFHKTHYDIPKRRIDEIEKQCLIVSSREIVTLIGESLSTEMTG